MTKRKYTAELAAAENKIKAIRGTLPNLSVRLPAWKAVLDPREADAINRATHYLTEALNTITSYLNAIEKEGDE